MSSLKPVKVQIALLIWSIIILSADPWLVFAAFVPLERRLARFEAPELVGRQDYCINPCGQYHGQLCCDTDEVCYTDSSGNALCSQTSAPAAATTSTVGGGGGGGVTLSTTSASYTVITVTSPQDTLTSASAVASSTSLPTATSTTSPSDGVDGNRDNNGLSTGAKVGIAIGVVAAVVAIMFAIVLWTRRFRSKSPAYAGPPTKARRRPDRTGIVLTNYT